MKSSKPYKIKEVFNNSNKPWMGSRYEYPNQLDPVEIESYAQESKWSKIYFVIFLIIVASGFIIGSLIT